MEEEQDKTTGRELNFRLVPKAADYSSPIKLIQAIQSGEVDARYITPRQRRPCVAELLRQGVRQIEIADMFKVTGQTVTNDKRWILRRQIGRAHV